MTRTRIARYFNRIYVVRQYFRHAFSQNNISATFGVESTEETERATKYNALYTAGEFLVISAKENVVWQETARFQKADSTRARWYRRVHNSVGNEHKNITMSRVMNVSIYVIRARFFRRRLVQNKPSVYRRRPKGIFVMLGSNYIYITPKSVDRTRSRVCACYIT